MLAPASVSVPVPTLVSEPLLCTRPEKVVDRLLPPTVRFFAPSKIVPAPSIEPAVVPAVASSEMSSTPPFKMNRAVPPLADCRKKVFAPALVVMVAPPAVLAWSNCRRLLLMMAALPAVLVPKNVTVLLLLVMVALPAVLLSANDKRKLLVMAALPAVLPSWNTIPLSLVMMALPAVLPLKKNT